ncbi:lytic transglycosylase domain-containing protein [Paenibacillus lutimineralis]|uniref:Lytic transglycosylase domain-containing protein n=1 Tax=Paenibacillus lutimineralis TaxID=2707005 RepID=A0A3Q9ID48_9BACL|nr:lytic transglycosylase domain-containing protein [Paenibacillus lutimineralis]AZS16481.1 lytic transglycosylase domain-containing protein [Paenibacillus lutimineralis]
MRLLRKKRVLLLLFLGFVAILFFNSAWLSMFYPIYYKEEIKQHAQENGLDPLIVAAIIKAESNYKVGAESRKGALGIMQIMPGTAEWIIDQAKYEKVHLDQVKNEIDVNVRIGTWYLNYLSEQFDGNIIAVIAAYNAGPTHVKNWIKSKRWDGQLNTVDDIPFPETRNYVLRVTHYYKQYSEIYDDF